MMPAIQKGRAVDHWGSAYTPRPDQVLITTVCRGSSVEIDPSEEVPSSISSDGYQDGFGEYTTHIPIDFKFYTKQPDYGMRFLAANVPGPRYLQYPEYRTLIGELESGRYTVLGISAYTWSLPWAIALAKLARERYGIREVWLGGYAVMTDELSIPKTFSRTFWGYSESALNMALGGPSFPIDSIVHPDLTTRATFLGKESHVGHLLSQRGCPNKCNYCADPVFQPGGEDALSFEAMDKILSTYEQNGIRSLYFSNQNTNLFSKTGDSVLTNLHSRKMKFGMLTSFRTLNSLGTAGIERLYDKGLNFVLLGLESLNAENLRKTGRRAAVKEMLDVLQLLRTLRVIITTTYMICFEDDTVDTIRQAKQIMMNELGITVSLFNITMPLPGTPMYLKYKASNLIFDLNWRHWTGNHLVWRHPVISPSLARDLLAEMRSEVNSPIHNANIREITEKRSCRALA
jgi:pyruvate-formate lyase-activating enzyme